MAVKTAKRKLKAAVLIISVLFSLSFNSQVMAVSESVSNFYISPASSTSMEITWIGRRGEGESGGYFEIERADNGDAVIPDYVSVGSVVLRGDLWEPYSFTDTGLDVNENYWYRIRFCDSGYSCGDWEYAENNPRYTLANKPRGVGGEWKSDLNLIKWQWSEGLENNDGNPDGTGYFARDPLTGQEQDWSNVHSWEENVCETTATTFQVCVKARNGLAGVSDTPEKGGGIETEEVCSEVISAECNIGGSPSNVIHTANTTTSITWQWDAPAGAGTTYSGWEFYIDTNGDEKADEKVGDCSLSECEVDEYNKASWVWHGLEPNTPYTIYVRAVNCNDDFSQCNGWSEFAHNASPAYTSIESAVSVSCSSTEQSITVTALSATGGFTNLSADSSGIYFSRPGGGTPASSGWIQSASWTDTGLAPNTSYEYYIQTRNGNGDENAQTGPFSCSTTGFSSQCLGEEDLCRFESSGGTDYYCTNIGGVYQWRASPECDDNNDCTYGDECLEFFEGQGSCEGTLYCAGTDTECGCAECSNCNDSDGWYDTGETRWSEDPENECREIEESRWEWRDFYCSEYTCQFSASSPAWVATGESRNKDDNTECSEFDCGVCCSGVCTELECCSNEDCDDDKPGTTDTCLDAGTCLAECRNEQGQWPDLIVNDVSWNPTGEVSAGQEVEITATVENQGNSAAGSSVVKFYAGESYIGSDSLSGIPQGSTRSGSVSWTAECGHSHAIRAVADANSEVAESNEGNNSRSETLTTANCPPQAPVITDVSAVEEGGELVFTFTAYAEDPDGDNLKLLFDLLIRKIAGARAPAELKSLNWSLGTRR